MTILTTCAHALDDEFEKAILAIYGVRIIDKSDAPYRVVFEGDRHQLVLMYNQLWGDDDEKLTEESAMLAETYSSTESV